MYQMCLLWILQNLGENMGKTKYLLTDGQIKRKDNSLVYRVDY